MTKPIPVLTEADRTRFLSKVAPPDANGCRLWTAGMCSKGRYGSFWLRGRDVLAHRVAYTLWVGPIPDGLDIDHRCHIEACVTPEHLRPATTKQNLENRRGAQANSRSGVRGVSPSGSRWLAAVEHNGCHKNLGRFDTIEEAEAVVVAARLRLFTHNDADRVTS